MSNTETEHHIPTTEEIRHDYTRAWALDQQDLDDRRHLFDLWLARHDAQTEPATTSGTATRLAAALTRLGLALYPWDGPHKGDLSDPADVKALASLLAREEADR